MTSLKIGDTVFRFDENRRVYEKGSGPRYLSSGGPLWREHWVPTKIIGETRVSWIVDYYDRRMPKRNAPFSQWAVSREQIERLAWVHDHKYRIVREIERCDDPDLIEKIAKLVGYKHGP